MSVGIQLRVGGKYRTRAGDEVEIVGNLAPRRDLPYRFESDTLVFYMPNGRAFDWRESGLDIVEEIDAGPDPKTDGPLRAMILTAFEDPTKWPMTDSERVALLRDLYAMAKGGAQ